MKLTSVVVMVTASVADIGFAAAQSPEFPSTGMVYNTIDAASLVHRCKLTDKLSMDCEFTQTRIRRKLSVDDATEKLAKAKAQFISKPEPVSQEVCAHIETTLMVLQGKKAAPDMEELSKMSGREKADALVIANQWVSFCRDPSFDNFLKLVSTGIEKDKRTCLVSSNTFSQQFRRSDENTWTVISQPQGLCGVVELSRFEVDKVRTAPNFGIILRARQLPIRTPMQVCSLARCWMRESTNINGSNDTQKT